MSNKSPERVREDLARVASMILTARQDMASGTSFNFGAIVERVSFISMQIDELPRSVSNSLYPDLQSLVRQLESLENTMRECLRPANPSSF